MVSAHTIRISGYGISSIEQYEVLIIAFEVYAAFIVIYGG
jgi:hypothetical protein